MAKGMNGSPGAREAFDTLRVLTREGGFRIFKVWLHKLFCDRGGFRPWISWMALRAEFLWSSGHHDELRSLATHLAQEHSSTLGCYYLAQASHIRGEYDEALRWLDRLIRLSPDHSDGLLLKATCHAEQGDREAAWDILERVVLTRSRIRAWQQLSNLVETPADYARLASLRDRAAAAGVISASRPDVLNHISMGAMRAGDYEAAKTIWRGILRTRAAQPGRKRIRRPKVDIYSRGRAEKALIDLNRVLKDAGIRMFLVSGTLLGCVREGRLLGHDKDIDVGVHEETSTADLMAALRPCGLFHLVPSRSPEIIRLRHVNGIPLDIFFHYDQAGLRWHGGVKMRWHNSPFDLTETEFLGDRFWVPVDHDRYLTENYGPGWRTPQPDFDSAFDTPNQEIIHPDEMRIYAFRQLNAYLTAGNTAKVEIYLKRLADLGEAALAEEIRQTRGDSKRPS